MTILFKENGERSSAPLPVGAKGCFDHDAVDTARQAMANALFPLYEEIMRLSPQLPTYNTNGSSSSEVKRFRAGVKENCAKPAVIGFYFIRLFRICIGR